MNPFDLTGKVAVITGGNSGIGLAFARGIAKQGGSVEIWARNVEKNAQAVKELQGLGSGKFSSRQVDVASEQAIADGMNAVMNQYGRIDFVFANAGPPPTYNSVFELPTDYYKKFQDVALHGAFFTLREGARAQWVVTLGLVPGTLALFQQVSIVSAAANAVAPSTFSASRLPASRMQSPRREGL